MDSPLVGASDIVAQLLDLWSVHTLDLLLFDTLLRGSKRSQFDRSSLLKLESLLLIPDNKETPA